MKRRHFKYLAAGSIGILSLAAVFIAQAHIRISTDVNWGGDIREILREHCMDCHSPGGLGPSYVDLSVYGLSKGVTGARDWEQAIEDEIMTGRMPPWKADSRVNHFTNRRGLNEEEREYMLAWLRGGAPQGPVRNLPTPEEFLNRDWKLGEPDLVFEMPEEHVIPADKVSDQITIEFAVDIEEDKQLTGFEFFPSNPRVVRSMVAFIRDPEGAEPKKIEMEIVKEYDPLADEDDLEEIGIREIPVGTHYLAQWARGDDPVFLPDEAARLVRAGSTLEMTINYRKPMFEDPSAEFRDRSKLGLFFRETEGDLLVETHTIVSGDFAVKAGEAAHEERVEFTIEESVHLIGLHPHLGPLGKHFKAIVHYPDGLDQPLLLIPDYSHKWVSSFYFEYPIAAPAGTRIELIARYDNSENNFENPNYPPKDSKSGMGPDDSKLLAYVDYYLNDHIYVPTPTPTPKPRPKGGGMVLIGEGTPDSQGGGPLGIDQLQKRILEEAGIDDDKPKNLFENDEPATDKLVASAVEAVGGAPGGQIFWCEMRGAASACGLHDYHEGGTCPVCKMELIPKTEFLAKWDGKLALTEATYKLSRPGEEEIYWAFDPETGGEGIIEYTSREDAEASGLPYWHKSRFKFVRTYIDPGAEDVATAKKFFGPGLNPETMEPVISTGHLDHNPLHGGLLVMAADLYHHVEATLPDPGKFVFYFYDDYKRVLDPRNFMGKVVVEIWDEGEEDYIENEYELVHAYELDEFMIAEIPEVEEWPFEITARVWLGGEETDFTFQFEELTVETLDQFDAVIHDDAYEKPKIPDSTTKIILEILKRQKELDTLVEKEEWLGLHKAAFDTINFVKAIKESEMRNFRGRSRKQFGDTIKALNLAANRLETKGHERKGPEVVKYKKQYDKQVAELLKLFPDAAKSVRPR